MKANSTNRRNELIAGLMLIGLGILILVAQLVNISTIGLLIPILLGAIFMLWGITTRTAGLMIPGGILGGIGLGVLLIAGPFERFAGNDEQSGAIFMLSFALGWLSITVATALFGEETHWWPLIPGAIMGVIGGALIFGGIFVAALELLGTIWPAFLIVIGLVILWRYARQTPTMKSQ